MTDNPSADDHEEVGEDESGEKTWEGLSEAAEDIKAKMDNDSGAGTDPSAKPEAGGEEDPTQTKPLQPTSNQGLATAEEANRRFAGGATWSGLIQLLVGKFLPKEIEGRFEDRLTAIVDGALLPKPPSYYLRSLIGLGAGTSIVGVVAVVIGRVYGIIPTPEVLPSTVWLVMITLGGLLLGPLAFGVGYWYLVAIVERREAEIDRGYPDVMTFMYVLSEGGMDQVDIIRALAESKTTFGEISREFQVIMYESDYLGVDYLHAMERHAERTPSDLLEQFFTDFLSVTRSGGDIDEFLQSKKNLAQRSARESQQVVLDKLQAAARLYVTLSIFPMLIVIMIIALSPVEQLPIELLYGVAYIMIPALTGLFFIWLFFSVPNPVGNGEMEDTWRGAMLQDTNYTASMPEGSSKGLTSDGGYTPTSSLHPAGEGLTTTPTLDLLSDGSGVFATLKSREVRLRLKEIFSNPLTYFIDRPTYSVVLTLPVALAVPVGAFLTGQLSGGVTEASLQWILYTVYIPAMIIGAPFAVFYELKARISAEVYRGLPELLRQISSANDTGMVLLDAIGAAVDSTTSRVGDEFATVYAKARLGVPISTALVELNNKYDSRVLARSIRLIEHAQRTTGDVTKTLEAAIEGLDTQIELLNQRLSETRMQVSYVIVANLVLFAVFLMIDRMLLDLLFGGAQEFAGGDVGEEAGVLTEGYDPTLIAMILLHASVIHAISSGLIAGYIRRGSLLDGIKYVLGLLTVIISAWWLV